LKGYGIGYAKKDQVCEKGVKNIKSEDPDKNIFTNFKDYGFILPQILRIDINNPCFREGDMFDAIICDPPYGQRAFTRSTGMEETKKEKREKRLKEKYGDSYVDIVEDKLQKNKQSQDTKIKDLLFSPLTHCSVDQIFENLLNMADKCLKVNGLLVCLYPTKRTKEEAE
jgi:tRNA G10  N-methylase Trm11